jgi:hypothetical protein
MDNKLFEQEKKFENDLFGGATGQDFDMTLPKGLSKQKKKPTPRKQATPKKERKTPVKK